MLHFDPNQHVSFPRKRESSGTRRNDRVSPRADESSAQALGVRGILVGRVIQNDGYRLFSLILASFVVNCQSAFVWRRFRSTSQAATSLARVGLSGIRRSRHWVARAPSSDSAISSKLPCFGV